MKVSILVIASFVPAVATAAPKEPTFYADVLPVLQKRCQECHRPGEAAPMSFLSYEETKPWAKSMKQAVLARKMPPWHADPAHGKFLNDRRLSQDEIDVIAAWADTGSNEGEKKDAPPPATFSDGWTMGKPDLVLEMPNAFTVPAKGTVDYTWIVVPTGFTEDKWVEKIEVRPGNASVVHHVVLMARQPGSRYMKDAKPGIPFTRQRGDGHPDPSKRPADDGIGQFYMLGGSVEMVSVYVPGGVPYQVAPGQARLIKAGSDLLFQMHYTANGKETTDRSRVGIIFAKEPPTERVINTFVLNQNFRIPPGEPNHAVKAKVTVHEEVKLQSLFPHMHVRGKAFEYKATYPTGETQTLLSVPRYDFNWQLSYYLKEPITLPKGTVIECTAWYDNSPNNPHNPDPKTEVFWGDQTWEEMLAGFVDFAIPVSMNPVDIARPKKPQVASAH